MRLLYYTFPDNTPEEVLLEWGCEVFRKDGSSWYPDPEDMTDDERAQIDHIDHTISCSRITTIKRLMRQYDGHGWTEHVDRSGSVFEVSDIKLEGNNSRFKYNHHL